MGGNKVLKTFSITDIGKKRKLNQDFVYTSEMPLGNLPNVFIVADGMGGHNAGDYASKYTVEIIESEIRNSLEIDPVKILTKAIESANEHIRIKSLEDETMNGMGTTVVVATCRDHCLKVANVGDTIKLKLKKQFPEFLLDIDLNLQKGQLISLLGPSGCGKSTTLQLITGLINNDEGHIIIDETDISTLKVNERKIAMVFQDYALYPHLNVEKNIAYPLKIKKVKKSVREEKEIGRASCRERV